MTRGTTVASLGRRSYRVPEVAQLEEIEREAREDFIGRETQSERLLRLGELRQPLAAQWLPELDQAAGFDLADALASDAVDLGDFV